MDIAALWLSALLTGILASGHCVLMCGSLAGALQTRHSFRAGASQGRTLHAGLLQQLGRLTSYAMAGGLAGGLGQGMSALDQAGRIRFVLQALAGVWLVLIGLRLLYSGRRLAWMDTLERPGRWVWRYLQPLAVRLSRPAFQSSKRPAASTERPVEVSFGREFALGMLWGWLPCGMVYSMVLVAWMRADALAGAGLMAAFGMGTAPALFALGWGARRATAGRWPSWQRAGGAVLLGLGSLGLLGLLAGPAGMPWLALSPLDCHWPP